MLRSPRVLFLLVLALLMLALAVPAQARHGGVTRFVTLPSGAGVPGHPEGIAADSSGNIYVATFEFPPAPNRIYVYGPNGHLKATKEIAYSPLGMLVRGSTLWVTDFGNGDAVSYTLPLSAGSTEASRIDVCGGAPSGCGLNAFAASGADLYISDSFGGRIFRISAGTATSWFASPRLQPGSHGFPPFGANGLAFSADGNTLFIANTADDRVFKLKVSAAPVEADLTTFAESINGADGIVFDEQGRLWVAANQSDELVALNGNGRVVARRGSFQGIDKNGAPRGLLFPASPVISGGFIYVTNLSLALTPMVGDEPEEDVKAFTVSRIALSGGGSHDSDNGEDDD